MNESIGRRTLLTAAGVAAGGAVLGGADRAAAGAPPVPAELRPGGAFDQYVRGLTAEGEFSGSVALVHRGRTVLERGYAMADRARSIPNRAGTSFSLASVTKFVTSMAIAQLVQRGKVAYTDTVGKHLDGFRDDVAGTVTVHHLLTHTSGLGDYLRIEGFWDELPTWDTVEKAWEGTLRYVRRDALAFAPGAGQRYSNTGFVTLGAVVAAASGRSYYDYVRENVFRASGTTGSDFYTTPRWRTDPRFARPYLPDGSDQIERHGFVGSPAGGSFATAGDMARIVAALLDGRLLDRVHADLSTSPKVPLPPLPGGGNGRTGSATTSRSARSRTAGGRSALRRVTRRLHELQLVSRSRLDGRRAQQPRRRRQPGGREGAEPDPGLRRAKGPCRTCGTGPRIHCGASRAGGRATGSSGRHGRPVRGPPGRIRCRRCPE